MVIQELGFINSLPMIITLILSGYLIQRILKLGQVEELPALDILDDPATVDEKGYGYT